MVYSEDMSWFRWFIAGLVVWWALPCFAGEEAPAGRVAVSCDSQVVLVDPAGGGTAAVETGPVGWLYPAPGALLFAPDTVDGRTTVIELRSGTVAERLAGVTLPVFGQADDRYVVAVPGRVLVVSFPDRVVLSEHEVDLRRPWRTGVSADGLFLYVLERPGAGAPAAVAVVDLLAGTLAGRKELPGDAVDMVLLEELGLVALAEPEEGAIELRSGSSLDVEARIEGGGAPAALAWNGTHWLWAAESHGDAGAVERWRIQRRSKGLSARPKGRLALPARPVRMAVDPAGRWLAVGAEGDELWIVPAGLDRLARRVTLPAPPRDVVWPDLDRPGPLLPEWSDRGPAPWATPGSPHP